MAQKGAASTGAIFDGKYMKNYKYEAVVIFLSELDEKGVNAQVDKIEAIVTAHSGTIEQKELWGRRELAYKISKKSHGIYVLLVFTGDESVVADLDRQLKINEQVLRHMIVNKDEFAPDWTPGRRHEDSMPLDGSMPYIPPAAVKEFSVPGIDDFLQD
jgi:small subunit ribosomal protein S6